MDSHASAGAAFSNVYADPRRADAYATLEFPGTYFLAYRDLPSIISKYVTGREALDFGCGAGRSTRFLKSLGFRSIGIDISKNMIEQAKKLDPAGDYRLVGENDFSSISAKQFDLILCAFPFDNIPDIQKRAALLRSLGELLNRQGRIIILGSAPEIYVNEWLSFTTKEFPENRRAKSGEIVRIIMKDVEDSRPVVDVFWVHEDYLKLFESAELDLIERYHPLGRGEEPFAWVSETSISPWVIYVLSKRG